MGEDDSPKVPRPPKRTIPNRANGRLKVVISGVTARMTIDDDGSVGKSCGILDVLRLVTQVCVFLYLELLLALNVLAADNPLKQCSNLVGGVERWEVKR